MGYILPVQQDTYRNYQYRIYQTDNSPHEIRGVRMVKFIPIQEEVDFYKRNERLHIKRKEMKSERQNVTAYKIPLNEEQELSGKGHHVNLKV